MKKFLLLVFFLLLNAADDDFLKTLNEVSDIATKTKVNIDKIPSNVEVIRRDFILKSGAKTLLDVLKYLPGIQISLSSSGKKELIIRGNKSTYRDKIKFLINGTDVTNNLYSNQFYYYNFPAALIKRIEFTKTPDSLLYGGTAFLGVINIITLDEYSGNFANIYMSNKDEYEGSLFFNMDKYLIDMYYSYSKPDITAPKTYVVDITNESADVYRNETDAHTLEKNAGLGFKYKINEETSLSYRIQYYQKGNFFGISRLTPLKDDKRVNLIHQYIKLKYKKYLKYNLKNEMNTGIKHYEWKGEFRNYPYDFNETIDNDSANDIIAGADVKEIELYFKNILTYMTVQHTLTALVEMKYAKPYDMYYLQYVKSMGDNQNAFNLGPNKKHLTGKYAPLKEGVSRKLLAFGLQDMYIIDDRFSVIYGARIDKYNDFKPKYLYKLGGVYSFSKNSIFKLLYNKAYRIPSFIELYAQSASDFNGNENLKPETVDMVEGIFIKKLNEYNKFKFVYYYGKNRDYIGREYSLSSGKKVYKNLGEYIIKGLEVSFNSIYKNNRFYISYSYNKNKFNFKNVIKGINAFDWPGVRENLIKSYIMHNFSHDRTLFISALYGSKIKTPKYIDDINPYYSLNVNYRFKFKKYYINMGADNITDHKNYYFSDPSNIIFHRYLFAQDNLEIPQTGRKFYINLEKNW